jgi:hypothetical protein
MEHNNADFTIMKKSLYYTRAQTQFEHVIFISQPSTTIWTYILAQVWFNTSFRFSNLLEKKNCDHFDKNKE